MTRVKVQGRGRRRLVRAALLAAIAAAAATSGGASDRASRRPVRRLPDPARGVVLSLHDLDPRRSYRGDLAEIRASGANAVAVMPTWDMATVRSPTVGPGAASLATIEETLAAARESGLPVLLVPTVRIERLGEKEWRGVLAPPDWEVWFASYRERLLELAVLAERHEVAALAVGSELCSSERLTGHWISLIAAVRQRFRGSLTYQANWDHREPPGFLGHLDAVATNAYFEVGRVAGSSDVEALVRAWGPHREELLAWAGRRRLPLLITEVGYASLEGATAFPWDYTRSAPLDLEEQRRGYEAFCRVWSGEPRLAGFFFYEWWGAGGRGDRGYTPRGKPALAVLRDCFRAGP